MKNYNVKIIQFILFLTSLTVFSCKKEVDLATKKSIIQKQDTINISISNNYFLVIDEKEHIDFFQPIKNKLIAEENYVQVLYEKDYIVLNLEIGRNADYYEDIYISKSFPLIIKKVVSTSIIKDASNIEKLECVEYINKPLNQDSRCKSLNSNDKKCTQKTISSNNSYNKQLFRLVSCENKRFSIRIEDNRYEILDKGRIISKGSIQGDMKKETPKIKLGKIDAVFYEDSLVIENYKNSDNSKAHFIQCKSKYLTFEKQE